MKLKSFKTLAIGLLAAAALTACNDENNGNDSIIYKYDFMNGFAVVTDLNTGNATISEGINTVLTADWSNFRADMTLSGLNVAGSTYPNVIFPTMPWIVDTRTGWCEIRDTPSATLATGIPASLSGFRFVWNDRADLVAATDKYDPALYFTFTIDSRYKIAGARNPMRLGGVSTATTQGMQPYEHDAALYSFKFDFDTRRATITLGNIVFANGMPAQNMEFSGVPFTIDSDAVITLECDALTPSIGGTPYPAYPVTELSGTLRPGNQTSTFSFTCGVHGVPFKVEVDMNPMDYKKFLDTLD